MTQPSGAAPRQALQQRVATTILEAAANVLVARGEQASMSDVAAAAGGARATGYRYFPKRQSLLDEMASAAGPGGGEPRGFARPRGRTGVAGGAGGDPAPVGGGGGG